MHDASVATILLRCGLTAALLLALPAQAVLPSLEVASTQEAMQAEVDSLSRQIEARPQEAPRYVQRGAAYYKLGEFEKAVADFNFVNHLGSLPTRHPSWSSRLPAYRNPSRG